MRGQVKWREKSPLSEMDDWLFQNMVRQPGRALSCRAIAPLETPPTLSFIDRVIATRVLRDDRFAAAEARISCERYVIDRRAGLQGSGQHPAVSAAYRSCDGKTRRRLRNHFCAGSVAGRD